MPPLPKHLMPRFPAPSREEIELREQQEQLFELLGRGDRAVPNASGEDGRPLRIPPFSSEQIRFIEENRARLAAVFARSARPTGPSNREKAAGALARINRLVSGPPIESGSPVIRIFGPIGKRDERGLGVFASDVENVLKRHPAARQVDVIIDSEGGFLAEAKSIYAMLRSSRANICSRVIGSCSSVATIVLCAGSWREAVPSSHFLIHSIAAQRPVKSRWPAYNYRTMANELAGDDADLARFYAARTGRSPEFFAAEMRRDRFVTAAEAQQWNLIDHIFDRTGASLLAEQRAGGVRR
jgi:ATP-dependent protease ClpP protease subunit